MKTLIAAIFAVVSVGAFAATDSYDWPGTCVEGNTYRLPNEGRPGDAPGILVVCKNGKLVRKAPVKHQCKQGARAYFEVTEPFAPHAQLSAGATCINGRWIFDNDAYNYVPTEGKNRCVEGTIVRALKFGPNGNPFAKDMICENGRMVELN